MAEYKKKNVKKLKAEKPKNRTVSDNYDVTSYEDFRFDEIEVKSSKNAKAERKFQKQKAKYLSKEIPNKRVVYSKKNAKELNGNGADIKVIDGNKGKIKKKRIILATAAFIIISAIVLVQILSPTGIGDLVRTSFAEIGTGSGYPITSSGSDIKGLYRVGDSLAVLSDGYFEMFNRNGKELVSYQHTLSVPKIAVGYTRAAIYDQGGTSVTVFDAGGEKFSRKINGKIFNVSLCENGGYAVSYSNDKSVRTVAVFDKNNDKLFEFSPKSGLISSLAITANGKYTAVVCINAKDGRYLTDVYFSDTSGKVQKSLQFDELVYSVTAFSSDGFVLTFSDKTVLYSVSDGLENTLTDGADVQTVANNRSGTFGVVTGSKNTDNQNDLHIYSNNGENICEIKIASGAEKICLNDTFIAAAKDNAVYVYDYNGKQVKTVDCGQNAKRFALIDDTVYTVNNAKITATVIEE